MMGTARDTCLTSPMAGKGKRVMTLKHRVPDIRIKRVYAAAEPDDGVRILVDRLWPRGLHKSDVKMDLWLKDVAPSAELRQWFGHDPAHWEVFQARYRQELSQPNAELEQIITLMKSSTVTLLYAAHDTEHNHARVLMEYLEQAVA